MVERSQLEAFRLATAELSRLVKAALHAFFGSLDLERPEAARDALLAFMPDLVGQYGEAAATLAVEWYDEMRAAAGAAGKFHALTAPGVPAAAIEAKVRYAAAHLWTPNPADALPPLLVATDKYVKQPGRDTIAANARRERVRWARVPSGPGTCAWCLTLASRDAVYFTAESAGDLHGTGVGDGFHGDCDCQVVRIAKASDYPEGYLPDDYYAKYQHAAKVADSDPAVADFLATLDPDDKNARMKAVAFAMRREFPDLVADGVHSH
jgi:hypothetical protein